MKYKSWFCHCSDHDLTFISDSRSSQTHYNDKYHVIIMCDVYKRKKASELNDVYLEIFVLSL